MILVHGRGRNLRGFFLTAQNIEQDRRSERMAYEADLAFEFWVTLPEEVVNTIRFSKNDVAYVLPICALVEENVQS
jgi:hypothetical protein